MLELRGKLDGEMKEGSSSTDDGDALEALTSLGYTQKEAREALQQIPNDVVGASERVKGALKILSA